MPARGRAAAGRPAGRPAVTGGPTSGDLAAHRAHLRAVVEPVAAAAGFDLEDLSVGRMGRRYVVRVTVDRDGGVGLDAVADLSRDISRRLDDAEAESGEFIAGEYQLEVSSPGTDRPLTLPRHWRRNVGRLVTVTVEGRAVTGRVVAADDGGVTLAVAGRETVYGYDALGRGRVEVEFSRLDDIDDDDMVVFSDDSDDDDGDDDDGQDDGGEDDHGEDEEDGVDGDGDDGDEEDQR